jgi:hypothetical protein
MHEWIEIASKTDVDGPFNITPIREHCSKRAPTPGLVFTCNKANGGIGNVRNQLLGCIRYAIEAGGGVVLPRPVVRAANLIRTGTGITADFSYMFDKEHFTKTMAEACPNFKIYESADGLKKLPNMLYPQSLGGPVLYGQVISQPEHWRERFDIWLRNETTTFGIAIPSEETPLLIEFDQTLLLRQPVEFDGAEFKNSFGRILQLRPDIRKLASTAIYELGRRFALDLDPKAQIHSNAYFGAHLRTEKDAVRVWDDSNFDTQSDQYIAEALKMESSVMYVATGSAEELAKMEEKAWTKAGINVTSKFALLNDADSKYLTNMTWDQQALVDYEILLKSSYFGGFIRSTFAWNIALRRHILSAVENPYPEKAFGLIDEYSHIYGEHDFKRRKIPWTTAIQWSMWP